MPGNAGLISLADSIAALRCELRRAADSASTLPRDQRFRISSVEIELSVVAEDSAEAGGEVGWWVLKANGKMAATETSTHIVRLQLDVGEVEVGSSQRTA